MRHITPNSLMRIAQGWDELHISYAAEPACGARWFVAPGARESNIVIVWLDGPAPESHRLERIADVTCGACRALLDVALARGNVAQAIAMLTPQKTEAA